MPTAYLSEHTGRLRLRAQAAALIAEQATTDLNSPVDPNEVDSAMLSEKGLQFLARTASSVAHSQMAAFLAIDQKYYADLISPLFLTAGESVLVAQSLVTSDAHFLSGIVAAADKKGDRDHVLRTLHIVWNALGRSNLVAQWLRRITEHRDCFIRSMAVSMLCRLHVNPLLIEKQLDSTDPRVRANAIEALWGTISWNSKRLLTKATDDPNHRVATNALLGLYLAGVPGTAERMIEVTQNLSSMHRAAIAWAMGYTHDEMFRAPLDELSRDPEENVRNAAASALGKYAEASIEHAAV